MTGGPSREGGKVSKVSPSCAAFLNLADPKAKKSRIIHP